MEQQDDNVPEKCPCCNKQVRRRVFGRFKLPTTDDKTNHFMECKPLRKQLDKSKLKKQSAGHIESSSINIQGESN